MSQLQSHYSCHDSYNVASVSTNHLERTYQIYRPVHEMVRVFIFIFCHLIRNVLLF